MEFLTTEQAATWLGLSRRTLETWRLRNLGPRYVKMGGSVRYERASLEDWIQQQTVDPREQRKEEFLRRLKTVKLTALNSQS
jgi:excisionase family DNA binding protein